MSKDFTGGRAVAGARKRLVSAIYDVTADAARLSDRQLKRFGRDVPKAVERLREAAADPTPDRLEEAAWGLARAVEWKPADLPESDAWVMALARSLLRLGSCLKSLDVARR